MAEIKYGLVEGMGRGREHRCATGQSFYRRGGKFVYLSDGYVTLCASDAGIVQGWLETPKDTAGQSYYETDDTIKEKLFVIYADDDNVFEIPNGGASTCTATDVGKSALIRDASGVQGALTCNTAASSCLNIVDVNTTNNTFLVKVIAANRQTI